MGWKGGRMKEGGHFLVGSPVVSVAARLGHGVLGAPELGSTAGVAVTPAVVAGLFHGILEGFAPLVVIRVVVLAVVTAGVAVLPVGAADLESVGRGGDEEGAHGSESKRDLHFYGLVRER